MKIRNLVLVLAAPFMALGLTQCIVTDGSGLAPGAYSGPHQSSYDLGVRRGREDGRRGLSRNPARHYGSFPSAETMAFNRGYESGYNQGIRPGGGGAGYGQPLRAERGQSRVTIMEGSRRKAVCYTAKPNVERTRFINEQNDIVVKSRGNHGPAVIQLFDARTGREKGRVNAYEVRGGTLAWAAGMGE